MILVPKDHLGSTEAKALESLQTFARVFFRFTWNEEPSIDALEACDILQYGEDDIVFSGYRGLSKTGVGVSWVLWDPLAHDEARHDKALFLSADGVFADNLSTWCWTTLHNMPLLAALRPGAGERNAKTSFDFRGCRKDKQPSVTARAISAGLAGARPNKLIYDDPENKRNTRSVRERTNLRMFLKEPVHLLQQESKRNKRRPRQVVFQTPHCVDTVMHDFEGFGFKVYMRPIRFPKIGTRVYYRLTPQLRRQLDADPDLASGGGLDGSLGKPTNPDRWPEEEIQKKAAKMTRSEFRMQYLLDTETDAGKKYAIRCRDASVMKLEHAADRGPVLVEWTNDPDFRIPELDCVGFDGDGWFRPAKVSGTTAPWDWKVMLVDPAGKGGDELAWLVLGILNSQLFLLDWGGLLGGSDEINMIRLAEKAIRWKIDLAHIENDAMREAYFERLWQPILVDYAEKAGLQVGLRSEVFKGSKGTRLLGSFGLAMEQHRVIVSYEAIQRENELLREGLGEEDEMHYRAWYQLTHLANDDPKCEELLHDDRGDTFGMGAIVSADLMRERRTDLLGKLRAKTRLEKLEAYASKASNAGRPSALDTFHTFQ